MGAFLNILTGLRAPGVHELVRMAAHRSYRPEEGHSQSGLQA